MFWTHIESCLKARRLRLYSSSDREVCKEHGEVKQEHVEEITWPALVNVPLTHWGRDALVQPALLIQHNRTSSSGWDTEMSMQPRWNFFPIDFFLFGLLFVCSPFDGCQCRQDFIYLRFISSLLILIVCGCVLIYLQMVLTFHMACSNNPSF